MRCGKVGCAMGVMLSLCSMAWGQAREDAKGPWDLELTGAYITPIRFSDDKFYDVNFAARYRVVDNLSVGPELQVYYVDQPDEDARAVGLGVLARWAFFVRGGFALFLDGGGGVVYADPEVPEFGTHFNFTGKGGFGASLELNADLHLVGGVRYFHLSNGNIHGRDQNPSYDGVQIWMGVTWSL